MQMARLVDPSRGPQAYSLAALTQFYEGLMQVEKLKDYAAAREKNAVLKERYEQQLAGKTVKTKMTNVFMRRKKLKNGEDGKTFEMPSLVELHTSADSVRQWIGYSTLDAEATYYLRSVLQNELQKLHVRFEHLDNLYEYYLKYWLPFGELLADIETVGIKVDLQHLQEAEKAAIADVKSLEEEFLAWVKKIQPQAEMFNASSTQQLQQLLYAPFTRKKVEVNAKKKIDEDFQAKDVEYQLEHIQEAHDDVEDDAADAIVKKPRNIDVVKEFPEVREFKVENVKVVEALRSRRSWSSAS